MVSDVDHPEDGRKVNFNNLSWQRVAAFPIKACAIRKMLENPRYMSETMNIPELDLWRTICIYADKMSIPAENLKARIQEKVPELKFAKNIRKNHMIPVETVLKVLDFMEAAGATHSGKTLNLLSTPTL